MRLGLHAFARVGHGHRETHFAHRRQVDHVVADVADLVERHAFFRDDLADRLHLEGAALVDEFELQIAGARGTVSLMRLVITPHFKPPSRASEMAVPSCALYPLASTMVVD